LKVSKLRFWFFGPRAFSLDSRALFYPLILRGFKTAATFCGCRVKLLVYLVQTFLALTSIAYLGRALWDVTAATERFSNLKRVSALRRQAVIGTFAMLVFSRPLVNHFALSVMTDSLAVSFTTAGPAKRFCHLTDACLVRLVPASPAPQQDTFSFRSAHIQHDVGFDQLTRMDAVSPQHPCVAANRMRVAGSSPARGANLLNNLDLFSVSAQHVGQRPGQHPANFGCKNALLD
jgi:hypothetical protein